MRIRIINHAINGTQTITVRDGSAMFDLADGQLVIRKFDSESHPMSSIKTSRPHKIEVLRDEAVIRFHEPNPFIFSTDYFTSDCGATLATFGDNQDD